MGRPVAPWTERNGDRPFIVRNNGDLGVRRVVEVDLDGVRTGLMPSGVRDQILAIEDTVSDEISALFKAALSPARDI